MKKQNAIKLIFITLLVCIFSTPAFARKSYTKKAPYSGFGKTSKKTGRTKVKSTSGHSKKTSRGYAYVNPYSRS